jgi:hypothetical protein
VFLPIFANGVKVRSEYGENDAGFTATYTNGRIQDNTLTFDAAGSVVHKGDANDPNTYQDTTFDASGRRTVFFDSIKSTFGGIMNTVQENKTEQIFDGDGRPVIEKTGFRSFHVSTPPGEKHNAARW